MVYLKERHFFCVLIYMSCLHEELVAFLLDLSCLFEDRGCPSQRVQCMPVCEALHQNQFRKGDKYAGKSETLFAVHRALSDCCGFRSLTVRLAVSLLQASNVCLLTTKEGAGPQSDYVSAGYMLY